MRRIWVSILLALPLAAGAAPAKDEDFPALPPAVPADWHDFLRSDMPDGQRMAQTIVADLDRDGQEEWIVLSEPARGRGKTWFHVYRPPGEGGTPERVWRAPMFGEGFKMVRGFLAELRPFPLVLMTVQAEPFHTGDSRFRVQAIAWYRERYRQLIPEHAEFRSQGGFRIEKALPPNTGDSVLVWTYIREPDELLYDYHRYEYFRFHFDGMRFAVQDEPDVTRVKHPDPESAGKEAGATGPDLRRRVYDIAEVP